MLQSYAIICCLPNVFNRPTPSKPHILPFLRLFCSNLIIFNFTKHTLTPNPHISPRFFIISLFSIAYVLLILQMSVTLQAKTKNYEHHPFRRERQLDRLVANLVYTTDCRHPHRHLDYSRKVATPASGSSYLV